MDQDLTDYHLGTSRSSCSICLHIAFLCEKSKMSDCQCIGPLGDSLTYLQLEQIVVFQMGIQLPDRSGQMIQVVLENKVDAIVLSGWGGGSYSIRSRGSLTGEDATRKLLHRLGTDCGRPRCDWYGGFRPDAYHLPKAGLSRRPIHITACRGKRQSCARKPEAWIFEKRTTYLWDSYFFIAIRRQSVYRHVMRCISVLFADLLRASRQRAFPRLPPPGTGIHASHT